MKKRFVCILAAIVLCLVLPIAAGADDVPNADATAAAQKLIDALPTAAEVAVWDADARDAAYAAAQDACDAIDELTPTEQTQLTGTDTLCELLAWFNGQIASVSNPTTLTVGATIVNTAANASGSGWRYDAATNTLTLDGYNDGTVDTSALRVMVNTTRAYFAIYSSGDLNIVLKGTNQIRLSDEQTKYEANRYPNTDDGSKYKPGYSCIAVDGKLKISGESTDDSLTLYGGLQALWCTGDVTVDSCKLNVTATRNAVKIMGKLTVLDQAEMTGTSTNDQVADCGIAAAGGILVDNATVTGTTYGYYMSSWSESDRYAVGVKADYDWYGNSIVVQNNGTLYGYSYASESKKNGECKGKGISVRGNVNVASGGNLCGYSYASKGSYGIHILDGSDGNPKGTLAVQTTGYVYAECKNTEVGALSCSSLPQPDSNTVNVITKPQTYGYLYADTKEIHQAGQEIIHQQVVEITGIQRCYLHLISKSGNRYFAYSSSTDQPSYGYSYTDILDLGTKQTVSGGKITILRATDAMLCRGIVADSGTQAIKLPAGAYTNSINGTYLYVKNGATLNLYLTGPTMLYDNQTESSSPVIDVANSGKLNILNGTTDGYPSLTVLTSSMLNPAIGGTGSGDGKGTVSITDCVLYARGAKSSWSGWRYDIFANLEVGSGAYVDGNLGGALASLTQQPPTLTMNGGTFIGSVDSGTNTTVTYKGTGGNLLLTNAADVKVVDADGNPLYRVEVTMYDTEDQFVNAQRSTVCYTSYDPALLQTYREYLYFLVINEVNYGTGTSGTGVIPLRLSNLISAGGEDYHSTVVLYLPSGTRISHASVGTKSGSLSYWSSAAEASQIIANDQNTASGVLFIKDGPLLMYGNMAVRGQYRYDDSSGYVKQFASDYDNVNGAVWVDYTDVGNDIELSSPATGVWVGGYTMRILNYQHSVTLNGLLLDPSSGASCFTLNAYRRKNDLVQFSDSVWDAELTLNVMNDTTNALYSRSAAVFDFSGGLDEKLTIQSIRQRGSGENTYTTAVGGQLTLYGVSAFANSADSDLTVTDMRLIDMSQSRDYTFRNLTIGNSTVIGLGTVTGNIVIDGGSVELDVPTGGTVRNSRNETLTKTVFAFPTGANDKKIENLIIHDKDGNQISGAYDGAKFDTRNIYADTNGKITLWLPEGATVQSAQIDGTEYYPISNDDGSCRMSDGEAPAFTAPTADHSLFYAVGSPFTLTATAYGAPMPSDYIWEVNKGTNWESALQGTTASYSDTFTAEMSGWKYRCAAKNSFKGEIYTTYSSTITLYAAPTLTAQPAARTVKVGDTATFTVTPTAHGDLTLSYQWQLQSGADWTDIDGETAATLSISSPTADMDQQKYRCKLTAAAPDSGSYIGYSDAVTLTVVAPPVIGTQPADQTIIVGDNMQFGVVATGTYTLQYQWQVSTDGGENFANLDGETADAATYIATVGESQNGYLYRCVVSNTKNGVANTIYSSAATLTAIGSPVITVQPQNERVYVDTSAHFSVKAEGNHALTYQWQVSTDDGENFTNIEGADSNEYAIPDKAKLNMNGWLYRCIVTNTGNRVSLSTTSDAAKLIVSRQLPTYDVDISSNPTAPSGSTASSADGKNGSVTIEPSNARSGDSVTVTPNPNDGYILEDLKVIDKNGNEIEVTDNGDGSFTFTMPSGGASVDATYTEDKTADDSFTDVPANAYYYDAVRWAVKRGITSGVAPRIFAPDQNCTRAQLAAFLYNYVKSTGGGFTGAWMFKLPFADVPEWSYEAVAWCYMNKIVMGYDDGLFGADDSLTREQAVTLLYRYVVSEAADGATEMADLSGYKDAASISSYAVPAMQWAVGAGIVQGADGNLMPQGVCTRAQIVTMLYRLFGNAE